MNPARIYLGTEGEVVLTDFARARSMLPQSAADVEADLRAGLASLSGAYGPKEALEEVHSSLDGARRNRRVMGPTSDEQLPPVFVTDDDIITAPGGAD